MELTEEEKRKIAAEEKYRAEVKQNIGKTPWWKPKGCLAWVVTIFILFFLGMGFLGSFFTSKNKTQPSTQSAIPTIVPTKIQVKEDDSCTLKAKVSYSQTQLKIANNGSVDWNAKITIYSDRGLFSGGYEYRTPIPAGEEITIGLALFADSKGNRFNPFQKIMREILVVDTNTLCDYFAEFK